MPIVRGAANAASATDAKRLCPHEQGVQIMKKLGLLATVIAAFAFSVAPASADLGDALKENTQTDGATTILFTTSFSEPDYVEGTTIDVVVHWHVVAGVATFNTVTFRNKNRCCSKKVKAFIDGFTLANPQTHVANEGFGAHHLPGHVGTLFLRIRFDPLSGDCNDLRGKAHLKLKLNIDKNPAPDAAPDGLIDAVVGYGFNVKVRDDCS